MKNSAVDGIWMMRSTDIGDTWNAPRLIAYEEGTSFTYPSIALDHAGSLVLSFAEHSPDYFGGKKDAEKRIYLMRSDSKGIHWTQRI